MAGKNFLPAIVNISGEDRPSWMSLEATHETLTIDTATMDGSASITLDADSARELRRQLDRIIPL